MTSAPVTMTRGFEAEAEGDVVGVPRVGCDLQQVAPVAEALERHGRRYLRTLLTPGEIADLAGPGAHPPTAESVAGRFAAKEAVLKVLRPGAEDAVAWPHIMIRADAHGAPRVELRGTAARLARGAALGSWSVSISHDGGFAMAVAVASHAPQLRRDAAQTTAPTGPRPGLGHRRPPHQPKEVHPMDSTAIETTVRSVLGQHGKLSEDAGTIAADADLYRAGMTSHASVNVMLGLEDEFDIEFPEERLTKATFTSINSITEAVEAINND